MDSSNVPIEVLCMACDDSKCNFQPVKLQRRPPNDDDVVIEMKFCGICHTDLHTAAGHLTTLDLTHYPCVPGHELAGVCTAVGKNVTRFKVGDKVGVGCMVDSCLKCAACKRGEEQLCTKQVGTYNRPDVTGRAATYPLGGRTLGGYTNVMVVHEKFAILIPPEYPLEAAGPIMCAGVTLFDPLRRYGAKEGTRVAIIGIGGLGDTGIKIAKAMGCSVTAVSSTQNKESIAKASGADDFICSSNAASMTANAGKFDLVLNTIPSEHDYTVYSRLLTSRGKHVILGLNTALVAGIVTNALICNSRIVGSGIGSIESTQAVIDLCAKHSIKPDIKIVSVEEINGVYETLDSKNIGGLRYVIDIATLNESAIEKCKDVASPKISSHAGISGGAICATLCGMLCCCRWW